MKLTLFPTSAAFIAALLLVPACAQAADGGPTPPKLADALRLKPGKALVLQPVQLIKGGTLTVTHTQFGDGSVVPAESRAVQLVVYSTTADVNGDFPVLFNDMQVVGAGPGGGPHVKVFDAFTATADQQGIIAILIGLLLPANDPAQARIAALPVGDGLTAEILCNGFTTLLPAVQKIREAARR